MKKLQLSTQGLSGDNLRFVEQLNARFAELPESLTQEDVSKEVRSTLKGLIKEDGSTAVDFAKVSAIDFDKLAELMSDEDGKGIRSILKKQGDIINSLKELGADTPGRVKSIRDQLKEFHEKNKARLDAFRSGESRSFGTDKEGEAGIVLQQRAATTVMISDHSNGSRYAPEFAVEPGLVDITRNFQPFIESYANTSTTNRPRIAWTEKYNKQGNAAFLSEGGVKPLIDFQWRSFDTYAKKVAAKMKVSTEAIDDVDWLAAEIEYELKFEVDKKVHAELLSGAGDGTSGAVTLKGLTTYAGGYTLTTIKTTTPNNYDAMRAAHTQIATLGFNPTHCFINPIDAANMDLIKDANGRPVALEYKNAQGVFMRCPVIETNEIPVGYFLMGDMSKFKIRNYKPFAIYYGLVNDDFEKNLVTILGERRLHCFVASNDTGAFIYEAFATVKTAITAI